MDEKFVKTISGLKVLEKNCRLIDGEYYLIGNNKVENSGDVYLISSRYVRFSTGRVVFDQFEEEYKLKNNLLVEGIIGTEGNDLILGYFTKNPIYNVRVVLKDSSERIAISQNVLNYAFRERKSDGIFYHISLITANDFTRLRPVSREVKESYPYDSKGMIERISRVYENNYNPVICPGARKIGETLKHYTFGLEFETSSGIIPNAKLNYLPLIPLRDGSIEGLEYATVPLSGPKGVQAIIDSADELKRRTAFNDGCSLHVHIGGMPRTIEFILAFYKLISVLQNEIFAMFPLYKKYNFGVKRKNYSAPFPFEEINFRMDPIIDMTKKESLLRNFDPLFIYLSGGHSLADYSNDLNNVEVHPQDPAGNQKWNIKHRYSFINFIPLIFGNHQTIEFRIHTPTYDVGKIIDFLTLNTFLIDYTSIRTKQILNGTDVMMKRCNLATFVDEYVSNYVGGNNKSVYNQLANYVGERKRCSEDYARSSGVVYDEKDIIVPRYIHYTPYQFKSKRLSIFEEFTTPPEWLNDLNHVEKPISTEELIAKAKARLGIVDKPSPYMSNEFASSVVKAKDLNSREKRKAIFPNPIEKSAEDMERERIEIDKMEQDNFYRSISTSMFMNAPSPIDPIINRYAISSISMETTPISSAEEFTINLLRNDEENLI